METVKANKKCQKETHSSVRVVKHLYDMFPIKKSRGACRVLVGNPEGKRPLRRPRRRWEDNIKMDLQEMGWGAWIGLVWLRIGTGGGPL